MNKRLLDIERCINENFILSVVCDKTSNFLKYRNDFLHVLSNRDMIVVNDMLTDFEQ